MSEGNGELMAGLPAFVQGNFCSMHKKKISEIPVSFCHKNKVETGFGNPLKMEARRLELLTFRV